MDNKQLSNNYSSSNSTKEDTKVIIRGPPDSDERQSLLCSESSSISNMSGILNSNQRLIFRYPDGTYAYAFKQPKGKGETDDWMHLKVNSAAELPQSQEQIHASLSTFQVLQIEDEIEFLVNNLEFLVDPQQAVDLYISNRNILYFLLGLNLVFEVLITYYVIKNESYILEELNEMYHIWHPDEFKDFFEGITLMNTFYNSVMYAFGFYTIFTHKVTNYTIFTMMLIISIFLGIMLTYLNVLNILMFVLKCITYVYARYVLSQLYTVLMVPAAQSLQHQQMQGEATFNEQLSRQLQEESLRDSSSSGSSNYMPNSLPFDNERPQAVFF